MLLSKRRRRTWKNNEWPDVTLMSPEKPEATKAGTFELRQVFDTIVVADTDFEGSVERQAIRFCDVLKRGCRGVPDGVRLMRALYDRARKKCAILDRSSHPTGGYLGRRAWAAALCSAFRYAFRSAFWSGFYSAFRFYA